MNTYRFETTATMKEYNNKKWWINSDIVKDIEIEADNLKTALNTWAGKVSDDCYIEISKTALKRKQAMYIDTSSGEAKQVGYVITGKTEFEDRDNYKYSSQYIDLWVTVKIVSFPDFD